MDLRISSITPVPSDEEAAAIVAALTMAWPEPVVAREDARPSTAWRFSGRWWSGHPLAVRGRPAR